MEHITGNLLLEESEKLPRRKILFCFDFRTVVEACARSTVLTNQRREHEFISNSSTQGVIYLDSDVSRRPVANPPP